MKQRVDRFFTEGINATLLHLYIHQAYEDKEPGLAAWFGNEFKKHLVLSNGCFCGLFEEV